MPPDPSGRPRRPVAPARRRPRALLPTVLILGALLALFGLFTNVYTDLLWFRTVGFTEVFTTQLRTRTILFVLFGLLMAAAVAANAVIAYRTRPVYHPLSPEQQNLERYRASVEPYRRVLVAAVATVLGLLAGSSAAGEWRTYLLWRNSEPFGVEDAQFSLDISFFTFSLPWWRFLVGFAFAVTVLSLIAAAATHYLYGGLRLQSGGDRTTPAARVHLSVLLGVFVLLRAVSYWLDRYSLATKDGQVGRSEFTGLTYTDVNAVLPAKTTLAAISVVCAVLFFANIFRRTWLLPAVGVGGLVLAAVLLGGIYPAVVQGFQVRPSEAVKESDYIARNIAATRQAYDIDDTEVIDYNAEEEVDPASLREDAARLPGVRLLDPAVVSPTYQALQQIRNFYAFPGSLDIDRYDINGEKQDAVVAVREMDISKIPAEQRNWFNDHLVFSHGFGFVAAEGNDREPDGKPSYLESDIPPRGQLGEYEPRIYFGEESPSYSIVGGTPGGEALEFDYPDDAAGEEGGQRKNTYDGVGGVPIGSFFNKLLYAVQLQEEKILLSEQVNPESKILYHRTPRERIEKVAPWLELDGNPYPAVVGDRIVWIVDGYTTSNAYPYSKRETLDSATRDRITTTTRSVVTLPDEEVNYIRNSVKATVDAYDGTVRLYAWDESDPVLKAWRNAFPGTVLDRSEIEPELLEHLRYPEDLFKVQRTLLAQYHVEDPRGFYNGSDFWNIPDDPTEDGTTTAPQPPYYLTLQMPGQDAPTFSLTTTFTPRGRPNLSAFAAVNAEPNDEDYGRIRVLQLPRSTAIPGPGQVQNNFKSNANVATTINLLSRGESTEVEFGNLLTLPVGGGLLYVEPVYVRASGDAAYPLLRKVLVAFGEDIAFEDTLPQALDSLFQGGEPAVADPDAAPDPDAPAEPAPTPTAPAPGPTGDATVDAALADAQAALQASQEALQSGDFAAYGAAQQRLQEAIARAIAAQEAAGGAAPAAPDAAPAEPPATASPG